MVDEFPSAGSQVAMRAFFNGHEAKVGALLPRKALIKLGYFSFPDQV